MALTISRQTAHVSDAVRDMYTNVATASPPDLHFPVGREAARFVGYADAELDALPPTAVESFAGVGYPFLAGGPREGETVLDVGSGSGTDLLLAATRVGPRGRAFGVDVTPAMMAKAMANVERAAAHNAFVLSADVGEALPLPDASIDVAMSNGVINLVPDKARAFSEIHRVLKPGGRLHMADIVVHDAIPDSARGDPTLWAACIAGADLADAYLDTIRGAGFVDVEVVHRLDYFAAAPRPDARATAAKYRAEAVVISARKPAAGGIA